MEKEMTWQEGDGLGTGVGPANRWWPEEFGTSLASQHVW